MSDPVCTPPPPPMVRRGRRDNPRCRAFVSRATATNTSTLVGPISGARNNRSARPLLADKIDSNDDNFSSFLRQQRSSTKTDSATQDKKCVCNPVGGHQVGLDFIQTQDSVRTYFLSQKVSINVSNFLPRHLKEENVNYIPVVTEVRQNQKSV